jgi:hypothetical protein
MNARTIALSAAPAILAGCATHGSPATNLLPQDAARRAPAAAARGQIISIKRVTLITKKQMTVGLFCLTLQRETIFDPIAFSH